MNWTDERVELLKKLWEEGMSASYIAAQLGGVTRNAVIGKVHRLKISRPEKVVPSQTAKTEPAADGTMADKPPANRAATGKVVTIDPVDAGSVTQKNDKVRNIATKKSTAVPSSAAPMNGKAADNVADRVAAAPSRGDTTGSDDIMVKETQGERSPNDLMATGDMVADEAEIVPISRRLTLLQLTENTCKWPIGDPLGAGFHFCGAKTCEGSPYCSYHSKIAFQPITERRRIRV